MDGNSEVVPGGGAVVGPVVDAVGGWDFGKAIECLGQAAGAGGGAELVGDDADFLALAHEADHGFDEIVAVGGVDPGGADDEGFFAKDPADGLFAGEFGCAVDVQGVGFIFGGVGAALLAVEDEIGREVDQAAGGFLGGDGEVFGAMGVDGHGDIRFGFGLVHGGVGGGVDDGVRSNFADGFEYRLAVGDVELAAGQGDDFVHGGSQMLQGDAELAVGAGDEDFHFAVFRLVVFGALLRERTQRGSWVWV